MTIIRQSEVLSLIILYYTLPDSEPHLKVKHQHSLMLGDLPVSGTFDIIVRRKNYKTFPIQWKQESSSANAGWSKSFFYIARALVQRLQDETHVLKVVCLNPSTIYCMNIFTYLL